MTQLKNCPVCGTPAVRGKQNRKWVGCPNEKCFLNDTYHEEHWNNYRPVEDKLLDEIKDWKERALEGPQE